MVIKILHRGTLEDKSFVRLVKKACSSLKIRPQIIVSEDENEMLKNGIALSPALIINDKMIMQGRKPNLQKIQDILFHTRKEYKPIYSRNKQLA